MSARQCLRVKTDKSCSVISRFSSTVFPDGINFAVHHVRQERVYRKWRRDDNGSGYEKDEDDRHQHCRRCHCHHRHCRRPRRIARSTDAIVTRKVSVCRALARLALLAVCPWLFDSRRRSYAVDFSKSKSGPTDFRLNTPARKSGPVSAHTRNRRDPTLRGTDGAPYAHFIHLVSRRENGRKINTKGVKYVYRKSGDRGRKRERAQWQSPDTHVTCCAIKPC